MKYMLPFCNQNYVFTACMKCNNKNEITYAVIRDIEVSCYWHETMISAAIMLCLCWEQFIFLDGHSDCYV